MRAMLSTGLAAERVWDAIVIGAGPAGALAARQLAGAGARVLLVEKRTFPRWKVCGACLNGTALSLLHAAGLGDMVQNLGGIELHGFELRASGRRAILPLPAGRALSRQALDAALVKAAVAAGAEFRHQTTASVLEAAESTRRVLLTRHGSPSLAEARVVLIAAGLGPSALRDGPVVREYIARRARIGAGCVLSSDNARDDLFRPGTIFMAVGHGGYVGVVRVEDGRLNIAAAFDRPFVRACGKPAIAAGSVLAEAGFPQPARLDQAVWQGTVSLSRRSYPLAGERWFLLGDATGYVEPFTGQGIAWALTSAQAIVPVALQAIQRWEPSLEQEWVKAYGGRVARGQWLCRALAQGLRRGFLVRCGVELIAHLPALARPIVQGLNSSRGWL